MESIFLNQVNSLLVLFFVKLITWTSGSMLGVYDTLGYISNLFFLVESGK